MMLLVALIAVLAPLGASRSNLAIGQVLVNPPTLAGVVSTSDFIGHVRCVTAGASVAEYVVIETWKGAAPEGVVRIKLSPRAKDYWVFPVPAITLVGEELIVCARRKIESVRPLRDIVDRVDTLEWRDLPVDFEAFLGTGSAFASRDGMSIEDQLVWNVKNRELAWVRERVAKLLEIPDPARSERKDGLPRIPFGAQPATEAREALERNLRQLLKRSPGQINTRDELYYDALRFCALCPEPRAAHFTQLLQSEEPLVRVAAAIFLGLEDRESGRAALSLQLELPGDAGVWAALALASYGEPTAIERALCVFDEDLTSGIDGAFHRAFVARVLVLLSNVGARSSVPFPRIESRFPGRSRFDAQMRGDELRAWWARACASTPIVDPWADELRARRVD